MLKREGRGGLGAVSGRSIPARSAHWSLQRERQESSARNMGRVAGARSLGGAWRPFQRPAAPVLRAAARSRAAVAANGISPCGALPRWNWTR